MSAYVLAAAALAPTAAPPPGIDPEAYAAALWQDTYDLLDDLTGVTAYVAAPAGSDLGPTLRIEDPHDAYAALAALHATGATIGAVVSADAPDLPGLLVGKLFGACEDTLAGVLPASDGRLVGLAARLPAPEWLHGLTLEQGIEWLHERAPAKAVQIGPGWHRLREPADVSRLDPRLDGFWATRALLSGYASGG